MIPYERPPLFDDRQYNYIEFEDDDEYRRVYRDSVNQAFWKSLDPRRNSRYETINLSRISNFTTSQSNVYAVWITLGYFEVDDNGDRVREVGVLRGEAKRHRAFFIIDRSIPVGFEPGVNHNADETILLRRYIE